MWRKPFEFRNALVSQLALIQTKNEFVNHFKINRGLLYFGINAAALDILSNSNYPSLMLQGYLGGKVEIYFMNNQVYVYCFNFDDFTNGKDLIPQHNIQQYIYT